MREPAKRLPVRASTSRKRRRWPGRILTVVVLVAVASGLLYTRSVLWGGSGNAVGGGVHIPGTDLVIGARSVHSSGDDAGGIPSSWPPVPADASAHPLGRPPAKASSSHEFAFIATVDGGRPVAWDPCRPIHLVVNAADAPPHGNELLRSAVAQVSAATGLRFVFDGPTTEAPSADRATEDKVRYGDRWSPVLVAWTDPGTVPQLKGAVAGLAGPDGAPYIDADQQHWVSGSVDLDGPQLAGALRRPGGWQVARAVVMHELGHLVGLRHVPERSELMYADTTGRTTFGPGDREGLRQLGLGPCFTE